MKLTLLTLALAVAIGLALRGRLSNLSASRFRFPALAPVGLGLQVLPTASRPVAMALLFVSFAVLGIFAVANLRTLGFAMILVGLALNFTVIAANGGMPVTRHALVASGQADTLSFLVHHGGAKHHLATGSDHLLALGDVIAIRGVNQIVSAGDIATFAGVACVVIVCMRRRRDSTYRPITRVVAGFGPADVRR